MRSASDLRKSARHALKGNWGLAVLTGLVAVILGAIENLGPKVSVNINSSQLQVIFNMQGKLFFQQLMG